MAQVAIITASDSGIGKECALLLAQQGFDIGITWHSDEEGAKDTAREVVSHGVRAEIVQLDLGKLPEGVWGGDQFWTESEQPGRTCKH